MKKILSFPLALGTVVLSSLGINLPIQAETLTQQSGEIRAELSYQSGEICIDSPIQLQISRRQQVVFNETIQISEACRLHSPSETPFTIQDLDQNGEPELILDFYSGGAHCCFFSLVYRYDSDSNQYQMTRHEWYNFPYELKDQNQDNQPEFHSLDNRFAYQFAPFATSGFPLQIWQYNQGEFKDVTRQYPDLVYDDAYYWWQNFSEAQTSCRRNQACGEGFLAAYVAAKALLGQEQDAWARVRQTYRGNGCTISECVGREAFFGQVQSFLRETGYSR